MNVLALCGGGVFVFGVEGPDRCGSRFVFGKCVRGKTLEPEKVDAEWLKVESVDVSLMSEIGLVSLVGKLPAFQYIRPFCVRCALWLLVPNWDFEGF